jgi:hypothetical protein
MRLERVFHIDRYGTSTTYGPETTEILLFHARNSTRNQVYSNNVRRMKHLSKTALATNCYGVACKSLKAHAAPTPAFE